jgi:hypothetical protein
MRLGFFALLYLQSVQRSSFSVLVVALMVGSICLGDSTKAGGSSKGVHKWESVVSIKDVRSDSHASNSSIYERLRESIIVFVA